ncbi:MULTISPECIES: hypothetical protein [Rhodopseudomonas]|uniref:Uncharacterized protein n=1 Tax=Rhodopseudomonas palustris TaxID=1076 RepID=A0A0D7EB32_RHOPL|nr:MULTISPECIES: hypothetical protein [Rhodopseudomonas]KIZ38069.1 hypothetical protein OO17_23155 [Rhodopseudomonas palustris]MDF3810547.1 hypothetical protein [Rhodopseudomonas sp. BAL398]
MVALAFGVGGCLSLHIINSTGAEVPPIDRERDAVSPYVPLANQSTKSRNGTDMSEKPKDEPKGETAPKPRNDAVQPVNGARGFGRSGFGHS